jgi:hypothetical protein
MWAIIGAYPAFMLAWVIKIWTIDLPAENRAAIAKAKEEERELAKHFANQEHGDRILERLVQDGAPCCLLSVRKTSNREIKGGDQPMTHTQALNSYLQFHEAMKLHGEAGPAGKGGTSPDEVPGALHPRPIDS